VALFRYSVLGPLVSRGELLRGELKATLQELAARHYDIPGSGNSRLSEKTIEAWRCRSLYFWRWLSREFTAIAGPVFQIAPPGKIAASDAQQSVNSRLHCSTFQTASYTRRSLAHRQV
jgi:hypothetical protein